MKRETVQSLARVTHDELTEGDEVVLFYLNWPLQHNSRGNAAHPCRGRITRVGRKYLYVSSTGPDVRVAIDASGMITALRVDTAKWLHRREFMKHRTYRSVAFVNACMASL